MDDLLLVLVVAFVFAASVAWLASALLSLQEESD